MIYISSSIYFNNRESGAKRAGEGDTRETEVGVGDVELASLGWKSRGYEGGRALLEKVGLYKDINDT